MPVFTLAMHPVLLSSGIHRLVCGCVSEHSAVLMMYTISTSAEMAAHAMANTVLFVFLIMFPWHSAWLQLFCCAACGPPLSAVLVIWKCEILRLTGQQLRNPLGLTVRCGRQAVRPSPALSRAA